MKIMLVEIDDDDYEEISESLITLIKLLKQIAKDQTNDSGTTEEI
jgi:hypothetical protein|tara:strand:- start:9441 stop:9575 length:135 start_codon:yes stop_codon:yes gene_type:complete